MNSPDEEEDLIGPLPPSSTEESEVSRIPFSTISNHFISALCVVQSLAIRRREIDGRSRLMKQQLTSDVSCAHPTM